MQHNNIKAKQIEQFAISQILKHGFLFIDIPRTSSTSIRVELGLTFGIPYSKKNTLDKKYSKPQIFRDHMPAKFLKARFGNKLWERIFVFTLVRNPWDRTYSMYNYRRKSGSIPANLGFRDYVIELNNSVKDKIENIAKNLSIIDFLDLKKPGDGRITFNYAPYYLSCSNYIYDNNGNKLVNYVGKYENREHDLNVIAKKIGLNNLGNIHTQEASLSSHYSENYDNETRDIISFLYEDDIKNFNYEFGD